jgi:hypothetical protein
MGVTAEQPFLMARRSGLTAILPSPPAVACVPILPALSSIQAAPWSTALIFCEAMCWESVRKRLGSARTCKAICARRSRGTCRFLAVVMLAVFGALARSDEAKDDRRKKYTVSAASHSSGCSARADNESRFCDSGRELS